jgi:hypothetical protein
LSISFSDKPARSNEAISSIIRFIPKSILAIALVGCDLDDTAARLILQWMGKSP